MKLSSHSLRSKVARRIFAVFLACALIPFLGLLLTSYYQVASFFQQRNQQQLHALAKFMGMEVFEKLTLLESRLKMVRSALATAETISRSGLIEALPLDPSDHWKSLALWSDSGQHYALLGQLQGIPEFTSSERRLLATGKPFVKTVYADSAGQPRILMSLMVKRGQADPEILVGEIENGYLWEFGYSRALPAYVHGCILNRSSVALLCDSLASTQLPARIATASERVALGDIEWSEGGRHYFASYWSLPLKFQFQSSDWIVALETSNEGAFESLNEIQRPFLLGIIVSLGLSVLFAIYNIRKRLVPVELLQEGTRRIAARDFNFTVEIHSNDEFEELANSVNAMAYHLGQQFQLLINKSDIDRAVLSLLNPNAIVKTILTRLMNIFPCTAASVLLVSSANESSDHFYLAKNAGRSEPNGGDSSDATLTISCAEIGKGENSLVKHLGHVEGPVVVHDPVSELLGREWTGLPGVRSIMGAPLVVKHQTLAVLAFYSLQPNQFAPRELEFFQSIARQLALAFYNAQLFETVKCQAIELEKSNKVKDDFLGIVSHELRTPMNVILGYLGLLHEGVLGELNQEQNAALAKVMAHSKDLLEIIEGIMETTKIESGAVVIDNEPIDIPLMLEDLKSRYADLSAQKGLSMSWCCASNVPPLHTDRAKLMRILHNLINNAIKFTEQGEIQISATGLPARSRVEFRVQDTGIGIPEHLHSRVFEMFFQADSSSTRKYGGIGIGLYIVNKLASFIGAQVTVESANGHGSTFTVSLPVNEYRTATGTTAGA